LNNKDTNKEQINLDVQKEITSEEGGSSLTPEEKELKKFDVWKAHKHEKERDIKAEYRETELHGVVGKEIHDVLEALKIQKQKGAEGGSTINDFDEKELRKYDDWKAHKHEKERDPKAEYREGELHGVVGKEIHDLLEKEKEKSKEKDTGGSNLSLEEKEFTKFDDWKAHKYEKNRDPKAEYREGELHGRVGKEIHDLLQKEKKENSPKQKTQTGGSSLQPEEKEQRRMDDWHAHTHEKERDPKTEYREGELHGVVGKEIYEAIERDKINKILEKDNIDSDKDKQSGKETMKNQ